MKNTSLSDTLDTLEEQTIMEGKLTIFRDLLEAASLEDKYEILEWILAHEHLLINKPK